MSIRQWHSEARDTICQHRGSSGQNLQLVWHCFRIFPRKPKFRIRWTTSRSGRLQDMTKRTAGYLQKSARLTRTTSRFFRRNRREKRGGGRQKPPPLSLFFFVWGFKKTTKNNIPTKMR